MLFRSIEQLKIAIDNENYTPSKLVGELVSTHVIPRPHEDVETILT